MATTSDDCTPPAPPTPPAPTPGPKPKKKEEKKLKGAPIAPKCGNCPPGKNNLPIPTPPPITPIPQKVPTDIQPPPQRPPVSVDGPPPGYEQMNMTPGTKIFKHVTMFICHETAGWGTAEGITANRAKKINKSIELQELGLPGLRRKWKNVYETATTTRDQIRLDLLVAQYIAEQKSWAAKVDRGETTKKEARKGFAAWKKKEGITRGIYKKAKKGFMLVNVKPIYWEARMNVHLWNGRNGKVVQCVPLNKQTGHANWCNPWAVGMEVVNRVFGGSKKGRRGLFARNEKLIGSKGNVGGRYAPQGQSIIMKPVTTAPSGKKYKKLKYQFGKGAYHQPAGFQTLPGEIQFRRLWETIRYLQSDNNPHKDVYKLPTKFPCAINAGALSIPGATPDDPADIIGNNLGTGFMNFGVGNGEPVFIWGKMHRGRPGKDNAWWKKTAPLRSSTYPKRHWQHGIIAHGRWGGHSDGIILEYYCLGRALGMTSADAFYACLAGYALSKNYKRYDYGKARVRLPMGYVYFPNDPAAKYVELGKKIWGTHGPINWPVLGTAYVSKEWKKGKYGPFPQLKKYKPRSRWLKRHSGVANKNQTTKLISPEGPR